MPCRYKKQRLRYILTLLKKQGSVKISSLVKVLDVTERTLRRDINDLVKTGHVRSCYGGAVYNHDNEFPLYENNSLYLHQNIIINQSKIEREISMNENNGKVYILGSFNTDLVYRLHRFPISGETTRALFSCCLPGGKGSNQAIASAQANARTYFTVKLGEDEFSTKAQHFLNGVGLEKLTIFTKNDAPTGSAVVMISEEAGDNVIVINPGANQEITSEEIISCYDEIGTANVFLTQMENNPDATAQAIKFRTCRRGDDNPESSTMAQGSDRSSPLDTHPDPKPHRSRGDNWQGYSYARRYSSGRRNHAPNGTTIYSNYVRQRWVLVI
ncbi:ribokinase [Citrobacter braakii]|nr:ribokinase [Citrobacter braakii]